MRAMRGSVEGGTCGLMGVPERKKTHKVRRMISLNRGSILNTQYIQMSSNSSTEDSRVVPHRSTNSARPSRLAANEGGRVEQGQQGLAVNTGRRGGGGEQVRTLQDLRAPSLLGSLWDLVGSLG